MANTAAMSMIRISMTPIIPLLFLKKRETIMPPCRDLISCCELVFSIAYVSSLIYDFGIRQSICKINQNVQDDDTDSHKKGRSLY